MCQDLILSVSVYVVFVLLFKVVIPVF
jgi:hypothetical protein